ncbi:probable F-box protein At2g36090 [Diospyros lotus]|uniref:probable F-box protein At2g36090 n=1 Tax=Diospyros lotus TaxID=55363 RepID=UPI00225B0EE3|nr:probable F-box protein At2g36090 [Diospyros lotus]
MSPPPNTTAAAAGDQSGATLFSDVHGDVVEAHILARLDGPTLAAASCASSQLHSLCSQDHLWAAVCHSTWPSTAASPRLRHLISAFPGGPRSFFSLSFPLLLPSTATPTTSPPPELISAVDIHYKNKLIFSKVQETETTTSWFRCSPFRVDLLDLKDTVATAFRHPDGDCSCAELAEEMTLSWVLIDPLNQRAANLSSHKSVSVQRHWLSGEVQVQFATVLGASETVQCGIVVTCGGSEGGEMQVREVSLQVEDMDGMHLTGKDSMDILHQALGGKKENIIKDREVEGRRRYREYLEMKRNRRDKKLRIEGTLDMLCVAFGFGLTVAAASWLFFGSS